MATHLEKAKKLMGTFPITFVEVILRSKSVNVDALAKLASTKDTELLEAMSVKFLVEPSTRQLPEVMELVREPSWMDPIVAYLKNNEVPEGKIEPRILRLKAAQRFKGKMGRRATQGALGL